MFKILRISVSVCNLSRTLATICAVLTLSACSEPSETDREGTRSAEISSKGNVDASRKADAPFFSLEHYFGAEVQRLNGTLPRIHKTVFTNRESESKSVQPTDWRTELDVFIASDINKPAWRTSYTVDSTDQQVQYRCTEPGLRTRALRIEKNEAGTVTAIYIHNEVSNLLYSVDEKLRYVPDSLYEIQRKQEVRIVGDNEYRILGLFPR